MKTGPKNYTFLLYTILFEVGHLERCDKYLEMPCLQKSNHGKQRHASYFPLVLHILYHHYQGESATISENGADCIKSVSLLVIVKKSRAEPNQAGNL